MRSTSEHVVFQLSEAQLIFKCETGAYIGKVVRSDVGETFLTLDCDWLLYLDLLLDFDWLLGYCNV